MWIVVFCEATVNIVGLTYVSLAIGINNDINEVRHSLRGARRNIKLAPAVGFEPTTKWLTATYSTAELCRSIRD